MASDYYNPSDNDKYVSDGDTCYADDLNKVNNAVNAGFESVELEVDEAIASAVENSGLSKEWAANDQGDPPSNPAGEPPNTNRFSSRANAIEAEDWASADDGNFEDGDTIHMAQGDKDLGAEDYFPDGTQLHPSAKTSADHSQTQAIASETSADEAAISAAEAAASAAEAIATNTISAGDNIVVVKTGTDPYDYKVSAPSKSVVLAHTSASQSIPELQWVLVEYDAEDFDTEGDFNAGTSRFTAPETGFYIVNASIEFTSADWFKNEYVRISTFINGLGPIEQANTSFAAGGIVALGCSIAKIVHLTAGDILDIRIYQYQGSTLTLRAAGDLTNWLSIARIV